TCRPRRSASRQPPPIRAPRRWCYGEGVGIAHGMIAVLWLVFVAYWLVSSRDTKATVGGRGAGTGLRILALVAILIGVRGGVSGPHVTESATINHPLAVIGVAL